MIMTSRIKLRGMSYVNLELLIKMPDSLYVEKKRTRIILTFLSTGGHFHPLTFQYRKKCSDHIKLFHM